MKKTVSVVLAFSLILLISGIADAADNAYLAKQWEERGEYFRAATSYMKAVEQTDNLNRKAELCYEAARCNLKAGKVRVANNALELIERYDKQHGKAFLAKLIPRFKEAGWLAAARYDNLEAYEAFCVYLASNSSERRSLARELLKKGYKDLAYQLDSDLKELDCQGLIAQANKSLDINKTLKLYADAKATCSNLSVNTCRSILEKGHSLADPKALLVYEQAKNLCGAIDEKTIERLVPIGKKLARVPGQEKVVEMIRGLLPETIIEDELPRVMVCPFGEWEASLKGGERSPYWYTVESASHIRFLADNWHFSMVFEDNERVRIWIKEDKEKMNNQKGYDGRKFYLEAEPGENCGITLRVLHDSQS